MNIKNLTGPVVKTIYRQYKSSPSTIEYIQWDGRDDSGNKLPQGLYIYKLHLGCGDGTETQLVDKVVFVGE